jgi:acetyl esterase/lipase
MVNYRLSSKVRYPEYVRDAAAAVVWVSRNIARYGGRPEALFVGGHSAGGYLTMALGMNPSHMKAVGGPSVPLAGLIPVSGQMATHYTIRAERQDKGLGMRVDEAAPLNHVRPGLPPILNLCAEHDDWKRLMENRTLEAYFKAEGLREAELHIIPDRDHGSIIERMMTPNDPAFLLIQAFIANHATAAAEDRPR